MNKGVQWRGVMLVTIGGDVGLAVRSYAATTLVAAPAPTIERYNPYLNGDRMVFTQVTRRADDSTTAAVWSRDLASGRESVVAEIGTGEAVPVTSGTWTAWSEMASDTHVSVRHAPTLRAGARRVHDTGERVRWRRCQSDTLLSSVSLVDNRLVTTNGTFVPLTTPELVRSTYPHRPDLRRRNHDL